MTRVYVLQTCHAFLYRRDEGHDHLLTPLIAARPCRLVSLKTTETYLEVPEALLMAITWTLSNLEIETISIVDLVPLLLPSDQIETHVLALALLWTIRKHVDPHVQITASQRRYTPTLTSTDPLHSEAASVSEGEVVVVTTFAIVPDNLIDAPHRLDGVHVTMVRLGIQRIDLSAVHRIATTDPEEILPHLDSTPVDHFIQHVL